MHCSTHMSITHIGFTTYLREFGTFSLFESALAFKVCKKDTREVIGNGLLLYIDHIRQRTMVGIATSRSDCWETGDEEDAQMTLLKFAFYELRLKRVYTKILETGVRGITASKNCGFQHKQCLSREVFRGGGWQDVLILEAHRRNWEPRYRNYQAHFGAR